MAKELPYWKFEPSEWDNGNIQMCSRSAKGLFIDVCSMYWSRVGELPYALALQKLCNGDPSELQELCNNQILFISEGQIIIEFLDEQLNEFKDVSRKRKEAADKRWTNASVMQMQSKSNAIRQEEIRQDKTKQEEKKELMLEKEFLFTEFWREYDKKAGKEKALKAWMKIDRDLMNLIIDRIPEYVKSTPDKKFRKDPTTYLNGKHWEDEIIIQNYNNGKRTNDDGTALINWVNGN